MSESVLSFEDALAAVMEQAMSLAVALPIERVPLQEVDERILARPVTAERDQPPFDRATRDGYAVNLSAAARSWRVIGSIRAGEAWRGEALGTGEAIEIMTGAPVPGGADAVVMVEHVALEEDTVHLANDRQIHPGDNIVPRGAEAKTGDRLLPAGRVLRAAEIAVAASCGCSTLEIFARPRVAIVATGDELVELHETPEPWQIRNSNSYALSALVRGEGGIPESLRIARDTREDLRERLAEASQSDLVVLSGGVSMGKHDLVEEILAERGAEFFFTGALIQPGKPVVFGRMRKDTTADAWTYFFGLPGNPVSTQVCFHLFVAPMLRAMAGRTEIAPAFVEARLAESVRGGAKVTRFLPAELSGSWNEVTVRIVGWQGSGDVAANARGNCYGVLPIGVEEHRAGETVRVLLR